MKIGILTQPLHANYGGLLQNYALQQVLILGGHKVKTIDWQVPVSWRARLACLKNEVIGTLFPSRAVEQKYIPTTKEKAKIQSKTNSFIQKHLYHTHTIKEHAGFLMQAEKEQFEGFTEVEGDGELPF